MSKRKVATIEVGANWKAFDRKCKENNTTRTRMIRSWIDAYLADTQTITQKADPSWLEDRITAQVRAELPANLKALQSSLLEMTLAQIRSELDLSARLGGLNEYSYSRDIGQEDSLNINVNSQTKRYSEADPIGYSIDNSLSPDEPIESAVKSKSKKIVNTPEPATIEESQDLYLQSTDKKTAEPQTTSPGSKSKKKRGADRESISNREFARKIGKLVSSVSRWRRKWDSLPEDHFIKQQLYKPTDDGRWALKWNENSINRWNYKP